MRSKDRIASKDSRPLKPKKIRCKVCKGWFVPIRSNSRTCSRECSVEYARQLSIERYHRLHPEAAYGRRVEKKKEKQTKDGKKKSFIESKVDRRSARSVIRDLMKSPEQATSITKEEKKAVEAIMALPNSERWLSGAKDWTPEQRKYAQKIEIKRISSDFSSIFSSFDHKEYGLPALGEESENKRNKKAELPYKYDILADDSDDESTASSSDDSSDSTACEDIPPEHEDTSLKIEDEEVDETDEENQF